MELNISGRPRRFADVVGQKQSIDVLQTQWDRNRRFGSAYILEGHFGCGKTTTALIMAAMENCENPGDDGAPCCTCQSCLSIREDRNPDVIFLNASLENGKGSVEQKVVEAAQYIPLGKRKVFILDECHNISKSGWEAMLELVENPPEHCLFLFCTTNAEKILPTIVSRSTVLTFNAVREDVMAAELKRIADQMKMEYGDEGVFLQIAHASSGAMRDAKKYLGILQDVGFTEENIANVLNNGFEWRPMLDVLKAFAIGDSAKAFVAFSVLKKTCQNYEKLFAGLQNLLSSLLQVKYNRSFATYFPMVQRQAMQDFVAEHTSLAFYANCGKLLFQEQRALHVNNDADSAILSIASVASGIIKTEESGVDAGEISRIKKNIRIMYEQIETVKAENLILREKLTKLENKPLSTLKEDAPSPEEIEEIFSDSDELHTMTAPSPTPKKISLDDFFDDEDDDGAADCGLAELSKYHDVDQESFRGAVC